MGVVFNELSSEDRQMPRSATQIPEEAEQDVKRPEVKVPGGESAGTIILCCLFASISGDVLPLGWSCVQGGCDTGTNHVILQLFSHGHMIKRVYTVPWNPS